MNNILFIINPIAGGGKAKFLIPLIKESMDRYGRSYEIKITKEAKEAINIAENNVDDYEIIVAVGGDGTINEVARGLLNKGKGTLGIIPGGTGNDMARSLKIPLDPRESLELLNKGYKRTIDIGLMNESNFLNIGSIGFDAEVISNHRKFKNKIRGRIVYILSVIYTLINFKDKDLEIELDEKVIDKKIMLLAVGNGKYYGGGMKILPQAEIDDGYLHICIISGISRIKVLFLFPIIFKGNHLKYEKYVEVYKAKKVIVRSKTKVYLNIDGELLPEEDRIKFTLDSKKLDVITI